MKKIVALVLSLVMVLGLATTAFGATAQVMYSEVDATTGEWSTPIAIAAKLSDIAVDADETNLAHYVFTFGGNPAKYYVKDVANTATIKVVYGNTTVYLAEVDSYDVVAEAEAAVFTDISEKAACGKLTVGKVGLKDTYYVTYDIDGEIDGFYKKSKTPDVSLMVNGAIVYATEITGVALVEHNWVGNEINKDGVYTSVKCDRCEKVATLFANKTAAGKDAEFVDGFGWITATAAELSAPVVDADKVESAQTFDAGIAMYVGMSVMAAAGSAVVLKKKD